MMISPIAYIAELQDASYAQLIEERKQLIKYIDSFEKMK